MTNENLEKIKADIERFEYEDWNSIDRDALVNRGLDLLHILAGYMAQDLDIDVIERFEKLFKTILKGIFSGPYSSDMAREIIGIQKRLGFLLKYKPYAVKAVSPLGYSVFIQEQGQGFSFQQHTAHKTEIFHILEVQEGGYVFICDYKDWRTYYEKESFTRWLAGEPDERYEQFRYYPQPGDVFDINTLGVVHTVIGCVLEEYATVSTDMVDRLFNQNAGKEIPSFFNRDYTQKALNSIQFPAGSRHVNINRGQKIITEIRPEKITGGTKTTLSDSAIFASRYIFEVGKAGEPMVDSRCASCIYFTRGKGQLLVGTKEEVARLTPPSIEVSAGDLLLIPNGTYYALVCEGTLPLEFSEQKIPFDIAFV